MRTATAQRCSCAVLFWLCAFVPLSSGSESSSSSALDPDLQPMPADQRGSILRSKIGAVGEEESAEDETNQKRKRIMELGPLEGREPTARLLHEGPLREDDVEDWAYLGANPKKLKHRRLDAVEVAQRGLDEKGWLNPDGTFDVKGALKLVEAQEEREAAPDGRTVQSKVYTLEELDKKYPTIEGDIRLGKLKPDALNKTVAIRKNRWEKSGHFVNMRRPSAAPSGIITDEMRNYRHRKRNITLFVEGSVDVRYAIEMPVLWTIGDLKSAVWAHERHYRNEVCKLKAKDKAAGFKLEDQELVMNSALLQPDSRTLLYYNLSDYDLIRVVPPFQEASPEQLRGLEEWYHELSYWRERDKCFAMEEDSDDNDPLYRALKQAYLETSERAFEDGARQLQGFNEYHQALLARDPNVGMRPHPKMDAAWFAERDRQIEEIGNPQWLHQVEKEANETKAAMQRMVDADSDEEAQGGEEEGPAMDFTEGAVLRHIAEVTGQFRGYDNNGKLELVDHPWMEQGPVSSSPDAQSQRPPRHVDLPYEGDGETFDIPQDLIDEVSALRRARWEARRAGREAQVGKGGEDGYESLEENEMQHASVAKDGYDYPINLDGL